MFTFIGLDGKKYPLDTRESRHPMREEGACKSKFQYECGQLIKAKWPNETILEEVSVPGHKLIFDFFLPKVGIVFEIDGSQHKNFNKFFHGNRSNFVRSQVRDAQKATLCKNNRWILINIDSIDQLKEILENA